jgi:hypothetical protein
LYPPFENSTTRIAIGYIHTSFYQFLVTKTSEETKSLTIDSKEASKRRPKELN